MALLARFAIWRIPPWPEIHLSFDDDAGIADEPGARTIIL